MNTDNFDIQRTVRNLIRIGTVSEVDFDRGRCRVATGGNLTDWLNWLSGRASGARTVGAQHWRTGAGAVTGRRTRYRFRAARHFSAANPAPSASAQAAHITFPDGAVIEYEPAEDH